MFDPIYSLPLALLPDGTYTKAPLAGTGVLDPLPLGAAYSDAFRKNRAPSSRELVQQLVGTAYACAVLNADLLASTKLRLFLRTRKGESRGKAYLRTVPISRKTAIWLRENPAAAHIVAGESVVEEVTSHPLLDLLRRPNPDPDQGGLCGFDLRWMTQLYLESVGRAYWLIERDGLGVPRQLWLLRPHLVREVPDFTGQRTIDHYEYGGSRGACYEPCDVIRFHHPDPNNPYVGGYSPLAAAIEKIRISRKEEAHLDAMLDNMGRPDAVWSPKGDSEGGGIGAAEAQRVRSAFRQAFAMSGRGGLLVSETPGTLQPLQWSPQDIVEIERARAIKTDICNVFGVPDAKLERNAANLAAARTADYAHAKDAGLPRCFRNEETLNARLVPLFDDSGRLFIAYDNPVREDEVFALEQIKAAAQSGAVTRNELRASAGLDPMPWGDLPLVPDNMVSVDAAGEPRGPLKNER
ncbi:MAG TPA: phage portal protein [Humisphaera sp.]|jgi:HK97 family phage portal protein|nr:phage portal protein [Humisphaera sp.]